MGSHRAATNDARGELEHRPRRDRPDVLPGGRDPFAVNEERALEELRLRYGKLLKFSARDGMFYAERNGHEVAGDNPDTLTQEIFLAWGAR